MAQGFNGTFQSPLDEKNRAVLPAKLREAVEWERLQHGFKITHGFEGCLMMFLWDDWRGLASKVEKLPFTRERARLFKRFFLASALDAPIDRVGRVTVADLHREIAGIEREIIFNGQGNYIEIWAPAEWKKYQKDNRGRYGEAAEEFLGSGVEEEGGEERAPGGAASQPERGTDRGRDGEGKGRERD